MRWAIVLWLALVLASPALAQETGGSFGGGDFGGGGSESSGGGSDYGGSSGSSDWGSSPSGSSWDNSPSSPDYGSSGGGGGCGGGEILGALCCLALFGGVFLVLMVMRGKKGGGGPMQASASGGPLAGYNGPNAMHVSQLSLGIDWRARRDLQATLARLAQSGDTKSKQGLATLLRETVLALRRAELSWLYYAEAGGGPYAPQTAEGDFRQKATNARSKFKQELVRGADGQVSTAADPNVQAKSNEGEGTVVVHLIVAARRPLNNAPQPDANQIRMALDNRAALTADQLAALEVVWSPAAETDRLSSAELEVLYPELELIDPNSIAGRIFCTYCRGPFAMELMTCPHCGAPAEPSRDNRSPR
jgi:uncharacterized membrane protein